MVELLVRSSPLSIHKVMDLMVKEIYDWIGCGRVRDDISLLIFEVK
jgi:hypothetical protein